MYAHQVCNEFTGVSGTDSERDPVVAQYVLSGWVRFESRTVGFTLRPGQLSIRDTANPWRFLFAAGTVSRRLTIPRGLLLEHMRKPHTLPAYIRCSDLDPDARVLISYLEALQAEDASRSLSPAGRQAAEEATLCLLAGIVSEHSAVDSEHLGNAVSGLAKRFAEQHLDDPAVTPAAIASAVGVSVRTLHRSFAAEGETLMTYLRRRRLQEARAELARAGPSAKLAEIASRWQFSDASHFTRRFKAVYGMTPTAFAHNL